MRPERKIPSFSLTKFLHSVKEVEVSRKARKSFSLTKFLHSVKVDNPAQFIEDVLV